ncbi:hypothetical protein AX774_g7622 [Zancudomyces culisetae]|uniref:Nudix hydrolase domain-containing protein n=1 Tax=Zancudomyces culisetae TaxID=1213189 RepID=A0A1R1PDH4_ZANCU|nr:hypothetical protein AX774_g7622 [Zancudomyces culisetae]|eukprot:OMH78969.1 hypothetical protein AX774_g7622 [Zancudomyces culisetae]
MPTLQKISSYKNWELIQQLATHLVLFPAFKRESMRRAAVAIVICFEFLDDLQLDFDSFCRNSNGTTANSIYSQTSANTSQTAAKLAFLKFLFNEKLKEPEKRAQLLFIERAAYENDRFSGQIGFPGGKTEPTDHDDKATAIRETCEEIGWDLTDSKKYFYLGELDDVTTSTGILDDKASKRRIMVSPQVFLKLSGNRSVFIDKGEVNSVNFVDLDQITKYVDHPVRIFDANACAVKYDISTFLQTVVGRGKGLYKQHKIDHYAKSSALGRMLGGYYFSCLELPIHSVASHCNRFQEPIQVGKCASVTKELSSLQPPAHDSDDYNDKSKNNNNTMLPSKMKVLDFSNSSSLKPLKYASDTHIYLWGLSLSIVCDFVDMLNPIHPTNLSSSYTSVSGSWPKLDKYIWFDVNWMIDLAQHNTLIKCISGSPLFRKPYHKNRWNSGTGFINYYRVAFLAIVMGTSVRCALLALLLKKSIQFISKL